MKYAAALIAAAVGANAWKNATVVTEVVSSYVTYCPGPTQITHGTKTYTVTKPTTLTITDCPCTITKPVVVTSSVVCKNCPPPHSQSNYPNATTPITNGPKPVPTQTGSGVVPVPTAGAGKIAALSGAGLAGVVGLAAFVL
ncbi:hypothetical protein AAL_07788 [Moelleriella libera RCEF 2490]|uniref:Mmc protein n=1 Tax=Moelleriella libera RCEF 2490 TaxID=1081109 RepID=A0A166NCN1_9HYPO|nr:hypothetical protein AAL_07788 [Moelleriella libera RCEF 2490]